MQQPVAAASGRRRGRVGDARVIASPTHSSAGEREASRRRRASVPGLDLADADLRARAGRRARRRACRALLGSSDARRGASSSSSVSACAALSRTTSTPAASSASRTRGRRWRADGGNDLGSPHGRVSYSRSLWAGARSGCRRRCGEPSPRRGRAGERRCAGCRRGARCPRRAVRTSSARSPAVRK